MNFGSAAGGSNDAPAFFTAINGFVVEYDSPVPEPGGLALIGMGLIGLGAFRRRHS
jgi:hypothetical protein